MLFVSGLPNISTIGFNVVWTWFGVDGSDDARCKLGVLVIGSKVAASTTFSTLYLSSQFCCQQGFYMIIWPRWYLACYIWSVVGNMHACGALPRRLEGAAKCMFGILNHYMAV